MVVPSRVRFRRRRWPHLIAALAIAVVSAACSDDLDPTTASSTTDGSAETSPKSDPTTTTDPADLAAAVEEAWTVAWKSATAANAEVADVAASNAEVAERLVTTLHPERSDPALADVDRAVVSTSSVSASADDPNSFTIDDCLLISPPVAVGQANYYKGTASVDPDSGDVTIESVEPVALTGCIPEPLAADVLRAYESYWSVVSEASNPPAPESERLGEVATGEQLDLLQRNLRDFAARGLVFIDEPVLHPEITEWRNATTVVVLDCQEADPDYGLFDEAGTRQPETPAVAAGEVDLREFTMVLEDDRWKVADRQGSSDTDCAFAPTEFGIPVV